VIGSPLRQVRRSITRHAVPFVDVQFGGERLVGVAGTRREHERKPAHEGAAKVNPRPQIG
jgi:hypothetical protein